VIADGESLVSHGGTALFSELANRTGLTGGKVGDDGRLRPFLEHPRRRVVLTDPSIAIADGADCLSDFQALRKQSKLFGDVASISNAWRAGKATALTELRHIPAAVAAAREIVWAAALQGDITIDSDEEPQESCGAAGTSPRHSPQSANWQAALPTKRVS